MQTKWLNPPYSRPGQGLDIVRYSVALILMVHSVFRIAEGEVGGFGGFLGSIGFPLGVALAWLLTLGTLAASIVLLIPRLVVPACAMHLIVLIPGIIIEHAKHGWFVVGGGRNGMEYSVLLIACLFALIWSYWPRRN